MRGRRAAKAASTRGRETRKSAKAAWRIIESTPPARLLIRLDFLVPFEAHNTAEFTLAPQGNATTVTWAMSGAQPFMIKVMSVFMNMDAMIGKDFEKGLANLKAVSES